MQLKVYTILSLLCLECYFAIFIFLPEFSVETAAAAYFCCHGISARGSQQTRAEQKQTDFTCTVGHSDFSQFSILTFIPPLPPTHPDNKTRTQEGIVIILKAFEVGNYSIYAVM